MVFLAQAGGLLNRAKRTVLAAESEKLEEGPGEGRVTAGPRLPHTSEGSEHISSNRCFPLPSGGKNLFPRISQVAHLNQKLTATGILVNVVHPSEDDTLKNSRVRLQYIWQTYT